VNKITRLTNQFLRITAKHAADPTLRLQAKRKLRQELRRRNLRQMRSTIGQPR
jgi:hypothetical protein